MNSHETAAKLTDNLNQFFVGKEDVTENLLICLLEVRFEAEFAWTTVREEQVNCVTDLKPSAIQDVGARPSVVIRRVEQGEALWDVAKSCGSTVKDICSANGLPSNEAPAGALLLIPTRRC